MNFYKLEEPIPVAEIETPDLARIRELFDELDGDCSFGYRKIHYTRDGHQRALNEINTMLGLHDLPIRPNELRLEDSDHVKINRDVRSWHVDAGADLDLAATISTFAYPVGSEALYGYLDVTETAAGRIPARGPEMDMLVERSLAKGMAERRPLDPGKLYILKAPHRRDPSYVKDDEIRLFGRKFIYP